MPCISPQVLRRTGRVADRYGATLSAAACAHVVPTPLWSNSESLEANMKKFLLTVLFTVLSSSLAQAQQASDPRVGDLVKAGKIRVGVHSIMYTNDPRTGALKAASTGIILLDIARTLGERIGVEVMPIGHPTVPEMLACVTGGPCDVGFMGPDP